MITPDGVDPARQRTAVGLGESSSMSLESRPQSRGAPPPPGTERWGYTVWLEIELAPVEQFTLSPDTRHWFQSCEEGAVVSEFSSTSTDEADVFEDPKVVCALTAER